MLRSFFTLCLIVAFSSGCSYLSRKLPQKKFTVDKKWVRDTLKKPHLGYRMNHKMTPVLYKDLIIQGNGIDGLVAYKRKTGYLVWRKSIKNGVEGGVQLVDNTLFVPASDGFIYALEADSGHSKWSFPLHFEGLEAPYAYGGLVFVLAGNNILYALNAETGKQHWLYNRRDPLSLSMRGASRPTYKNGKLYVGFSDGFLVALDARRGTVLWERKLNRNRRFRDIDAGPVIEGNSLYIASYDGALYSIDPDSGKTNWRLDAGGASSVTVGPRALFFSSSNGQTYAVQKKSGKVIWSKNLKSGSLTQPRLYRGIVVVGVTDGPLYFLDSENGEQISQFHTGRGVSGTPRIDSEGNLYFISVNANLFALKLQWRSVTEEWPWETAK